MPTSVARALNDSPTSLEKIPVQFKIGRPLLSLINYHSEKQNVSRNLWIASAVFSLLREEKAQPLAITAEELLSNKTIIQVRLDREILSLVDEICEQKNIPRTIFVLDACLSKLRRRRDRIKQATQRINREVG